MTAAPTAAPSSTASKGSNKQTSEMQEHAKACRAWFCSLSAEDKAAATACEDPKFIRMYLNLAKRMENRSSSTASGSNGSPSIPSSSSKPANHPRSEAAQASLPLSISRRHLAKMYDDKAITLLSPPPTISASDHSNKKKANAGNTDHFDNCRDEVKLNSVSVSDTITSQSEGPMRIQCSRLPSSDISTKLSYVDTIKVSVSKEKLCDNQTTARNVKNHVEISQSSSSCSDNTFKPLVNKSQEAKSATCETSMKDINVENSSHMRDKMRNSHDTEEKNCSLPLCIDSHFFSVNQTKAIASASLLQSKARLAALTAPFGRNGIEVIMLDPFWMDSGTSRKQNQQPLFCLANDILQAPPHAGFLSSPPRKYCELVMTDSVVLPTWLIPCSEAFWNSRKSSNGLNISSSGDDVNIPSHLLLIARVELSIWTAFWQSKSHHLQQRAWSSSTATNGSNTKLGRILCRAKKFRQYGKTIGLDQCRKIMSPVTLLSDSADTQSYVSEYDNLDKLILMPVPWVLLHGRDTEQSSGNSVGYAGSMHPVWSCIEEVERAIADRVWSGVSGEIVSKSNENTLNTSSNAMSSISTNVPSIANANNANKKKKKGKGSKKKKKKQAQTADRKNANSTIACKSSLSNSTDVSSTVCLDTEKQQLLKNKETVSSFDCVGNKSISSIVSSSSASSASSSSTAIPTSTIYRPPQKQEIVEEATTLKQKVKEVQNKSLTITTIAAGKTIVVNNGSLSQTLNLSPLSLNPSNLSSDANDGGEWDVVGQKPSRGRSSNRWGVGNSSGSSSLSNERWNHNNGKHSQKCSHHHGDNKVSSGTLSTRNGKQNHHGSGNNKRHAKNKKLVNDIVVNSLLQLVEAEVDRRSVAAEKIQSIRSAQICVNKKVKNVKSSNESDPSLQTSFAVQVDSSYSGVTCGTVTTTTAYPESTSFSTANNTAAPPVMTVTNDICIGGNSTTSSVASSLDNDHHPHSFASHHDGTEGKANHHNQDDPSRSVGYHLLNVCNRLSCDMATFMGRRGVALATRRRERGRLLQALQSTACRIWSSNNCHVEMYGSCATQLDLPSSDLDLVICGLPVEKNTQNTAASRVYQLAEELERQSWAVHVKPIATATVPVVKLLADPSRISPTVSNLPQQMSHQFMQHVHPHHHIHHPHQYVPTWRGADVMNGLLQVDITFEGPEHGGVGSTEFAARMVQDAMNESGLPQPEATPAVQVVMVLKELLAQRRLNEPFSGGLSSYGLILMVFAIIRENRALRAQYKVQAEMMLAAVQQEEQNQLQQKKQLISQNQQKVSQMVKTSSWASIAMAKQQHSNISAPKITHAVSTPVPVTPTNHSKIEAEPNEKVSNVNKTMSPSNETTMKSVLIETSSPAAPGTVSSSDVTSEDNKVPYSNKNNEGFLPESNDILEVLCSGEPTAGKLLMHFLLFYGHIFDSTKNAIEVRSPQSPVISRQMGAVYDPVTGMLVADQLVVYDPLEGSEKNNVARSCFAWSSIRWVFAQSYTTLTNTLDRRGSRGEEITDEKSPLLELLMSY